MSKLIVIMIDGVSADYFRDNCAKLPHLNKLAKEGFVVDRLHAVHPATSLPGRTTMMTGVTCDQHGAYGNTIWDGKQFRYSTPYDVTAKSLPQEAMEKGLDVAVMGYGMLRPDQAHVFRHPWWVGEMIQRGRDNSPQHAEDGWLKTAKHIDKTGRLETLFTQGFLPDTPDAYASSANPALTYLSAELAGDAAMMQWSAGLATSNQAPDFIVTEILTPDSVQHKTGYESLLSHWSIMYSDALVGQMLTSLKAAGRGDYNLAIMSDHGHKKVDRVIHPDVIVPDAEYAMESGWLFVNYQNQKELKNITTKLTEHGVELTDGDMIPEKYKSEIAAFVAPEGMTFEPVMGDAPEEPTGIPHTICSHGFRPGTSGDDRFCVFWGPDVKSGSVASADAIQITPTLAKLLGLGYLQETSIL
jgi:predicted AlkP superfamily pyrophosphatase or phosphodiesterase